MYSIKYIVLFIFIIFINPVYAENIYVDVNETDCADYDPTQSQGNRCGAGSYQMYDTLQEAFDNMSGGDDVYIRGGTYTATDIGNGGQSGAIWTLLYTADGTSENKSSVQSYPGEWAILDGNSQNTTYGVVLGYRATDSTHTHTYDYTHWLIERLEIKNGVGNADYAGGIWMNGGPFTIRYCYFNGNKTTAQGENPNALTGKAWQNVIVEYNYFYDNGGSTGDNCSHIAMYTDYEYGTRAVLDINDAVYKNEIRYNLFDTAYTAVKHKGDQDLTADGTQTSTTYQEYGDKIHHNIILNSTHGISGRQDYQQIYNNILDDAPIWTQDSCSTCYNRFQVTVYNNTILSDQFVHQYAIDETIYTYDDYITVVNNIVTGGTGDNQFGGTIALGYRMDDNSPSTVTWTNMTLDNNMVYNPDDTSHFTVGRYAASCSGNMTTAAANTCGSVTNYTSTAANLFAGATGADKYKTVGTFSDSMGEATIANGGTGGNHPYLSGVTIPSYVGATNPSDDDWVAGVLALDVSYFTSAEEGSDPTWIEGAEEESSTATIKGISGYFNTN